MTFAKLWQIYLEYGPVNSDFNQILRFQGSNHSYESPKPKHLRPKLQIHDLIKAFALFLLRNFSFVSALVPNLRKFGPRVSMAGHGIIQGPVIWQHLHSTTNDALGQEKNLHIPIVIRSHWWQFNFTILMVICWVFNGTRAPGPVNMPRTSHSKENLLS